MSNKPKVLIITEGKKTEPKLYRKAFELFPLFNKYEIYSYKANAYDLYGYLEPYWKEKIVSFCKFCRNMRIVKRRRKY